MNMVPKSGDNPRITSIPGGHCDITVVAMNSAMPFYNSGHQDPWRDEHREEPVAA